MTQEDKSVADLVSLTALVWDAGTGAGGGIRLSTDNLVAVAARFSESPITGPDRPLISASDAEALLDGLEKLS